MFKTIDRYILKELIEPFLFGLGAFTVILSASMILFELVRAVILHGMPFLVAGRLFLYRLPAVIVYIFPMATLLAALLAFGRLSADSEIIALRASGISLYRLVRPVLFLGVVISLTTLLFYDVVVPESNRAAEVLLLEAKIRKAPKIQENVFVPEIVNGELNRIFYARKMKGSLMEGVIVQEFVDGKLNQIINARKATWQKDRWLFQDGIIYLLSEEGEYKHLLRFKEQYITIKYTPTDFAAGRRPPENMNIRELWDYIGLQKKTGQNTTDLAIQLHMKISIPFACLIFALLGTPLGLRPTRTGGTMGLGISVLVIFLYYVTMFISMAIGELELIPPVMAAWTPNILAGGVGIYILRKAAE